MKKALIEFNPKSRVNNNAWNSSVDDKLWLLTKEEFELIPAGSELISITGVIKIKGKDPIDMDTRFGYIAWGFLDSQLPKFNI